jgi:hypothetical protein
LSKKKCVKFANGLVENSRLNSSSTDEGVASIGSVIIAATDQKWLKCYLLVSYGPRVLKNDIFTLRGAPKVE